MTVSDFLRKYFSATELGKIQLLKGNLIVQPKNLYIELLYLTVKHVQCLICSME